MYYKICRTGTETYPENRLSTETTKNSLSGLKNHFRSYLKTKFLDYLDFSEQNYFSLGEPIDPQFTFKINGDPRRDSYAFQDEQMA